MVDATIRSESGRSPEPIVAWQASGRSKRRLTATGVLIGAMALGALAVGAVAIGTLAIGRLAISRVRLKQVVIDELVVRRARGL